MKAKDQNLLAVGQQVQQVAKVHIAAARLVMFLGAAS